MNHRDSLLLLSGQTAPAGVYRNLFTGEEVSQSGCGRLGYESDGSSALYIRLTHRAAQDTDATGRLNSQPISPYSTRKH